MVTSSINAPPNGSISLWQGVADSANGPALQRLPPKKVLPTGKKANCHNSSFRRKVRWAHATIGTSRERRPAHRMGSTIALEYPSQGHLARCRNEANLENSLGVSKAEARRLRGIPTEGGVEPLDSIE